MQLTFSAEQDQLKDSLGRLLRDHAPPSAIRALIDSPAGYQNTLWQQLGNLGVIGAHLDEADGGQGLSLIELGIIMEAMGHALACSPYFGSSVLAATALATGGTQQHRAELLPGIASGATIATLAIAENPYHWQTSDFATTATVAASGAVTLSGSKRFVIDAAAAEHIFVAAQLEGAAQGCALFKVDPDAPGIEFTPLASIDTTRRCADIRFTRTPAVQIGASEDCESALQRTLQVGAIALANEMVGGAAYLLDTTLAYVDLRMQFGRKIGSFQAVKHKCADMLLELELAKSTAYVAAATYAENPAHADLPMLAAMAKANAADTFAWIAAECIQLHGGIGFTWDNDIHFWYKRAKASELLLGDSAYHREQVMQHWPAANTAQGNPL